MTKSIAFLYLLLILPFSVSAEASGSEASALVVPGRSVCGVSRGTARETLERKFGPGRLEDTSVHIGEGYYSTGTVIDGGTDGEMRIIWENDDMDLVSEIVVVGTAVRTAEGVGIGTTLRELEGVIGPFDLTGFAWDCEGTVLLEGSLWDDFSDGSFLVRLAPSPETVEEHPDIYAGAMGDAVFRSSDPSMQTLDPAVYSLSIRFMQY